MIERYEVVSQLGEDILGTVYIADDTMLQRRVMMRHIENSKNAARDDSWKKEFTEYTGKMGALQHPNMLTIYDISIQDDGVYVVSQFVEGELLAERLQRGALRQIGVYRMASDMLEVIHAAHEAGVFHGALHISSVKRVDRASGGHRSLLVDLGLNKLVSMVKGEKVEVVDPVLMAPELNEKDHEPDVKADLFMLGQLCYTALVGGHPYSNKSAEECIELYSNDGIPSIEDYVEDIDPRFSAWMMQMVEADPEKRFVDSGEAMVALHSFEIEESEPNVPGVTHVVYDRAISGPQLVTASHPVSVHPGTTMGGDSINSNGSQLDMPEDYSEVDLANKNKRKKIFVCAGGGLVCLLIFGLIMLLTRDDKEDEITKDQEEEVIHLKHAIRIEDVRIVNTVENEKTPVVIDLDGEKTLDWFVAHEIPTPSNYIDKVDGSYIQAVTPVSVTKEYNLTLNPVVFKSKGTEIIPRAVVRHSKGAKVGSGYEAQIRIPPRSKESVTVNLYITQKFCDIQISVLDPTTGNTLMKKIPFTEHGVIHVPLEIDGPSSGDFYVIKATAASASPKGQLIMGISGILVNRR